MNPRRFVKTFQPWKTAKVESGESNQTIRPTPKRPQDMPRPGDILDARQWTGKPYRSKQRKLGEFRIVSVYKVSIRRESVKVGKFGTWKLNGILDQLARDDGFMHWSSMVHWFEENHGLPFVGVLIVWEGKK